MVVEQVLRLQVSVGDAQRVEVLQAVKHHLQHPGGVTLREGAAGDDAVEQLPPGGELHHHVDALGCLEHLHQLDDVGVADTPQHAQLRLAHLAALPVPRLDHLDGVGLPRALVLHADHPAEAAAADQRFNVVLGGNARVELGSVLGHLPALRVRQLGGGVGRLDQSGLLLGRVGGDGTRLVPSVGGLHFALGEISADEVLVDVCLRRLWSVNLPKKRKRIITFTIAVKIQFNKVQIEFRGNNS